MNRTLRYVPFFRSLQQELIVLKSFDFKNTIYPCLEIVKEVDRLPRKPKDKTKPPPKQKKFEEVYLPIIRSIKAKKIFVDLPTSIRESKGMNPEAIAFLTKVIASRTIRTQYMLKFGVMSDRVIPVISTYFDRTNEKGSINLQEADLRPTFNVLAFRTFQRSFNRDISQIKAIANQHDYVIMDWDDTVVEADDPEHQQIITKLKELPCTIITHRNAIPDSLTNTSLKHDTVVDIIDCRLLNVHKGWGGSCFSDYSGIKRGSIRKGGSISPGFLFYDAVNNEFYGYKGEEKDLDEFRLTIVPAVVASLASRRMLRHPLGYLDSENFGWRIIQDIHTKLDNGKSQAKFKRVAMEHYLHCLKKRIEHGDFD